MLSEVRQAERQVLCDITYMWNLKELDFFFNLSYCPPKAKVLWCRYCYFHLHVRNLNHRNETTCLWIQMY